MRGAVVYVYGLAEGPVKIGKSADVSHRVAALRGGSAIGRELQFATLPTMRASQIEAQAQAQLAPWRLGGEWFDVAASRAIDTVHAAIVRPDPAFANKKTPGRPPLDVRMEKMRVRLTHEIIARVEAEHARNPRLSKVEIVRQLIEAGMKAKGEGG